ncbi:hypothetical protein [Novosphingobium sp.]|jgi:hypothetical protein|uniref:hypothetical protein n=1 Tax=Novosphingobium sp. TaxID=1874826 RepID=UPI0031D7F2B9
MRQVLIAAAAALSVGAFVAPAFAGEAGDVRAEIRSGVNWQDGQAAKGTIGGAIGYDYNLPGGAFIGVEQAIDKTLVGRANAVGSTSARFGIHATPKDKLYVISGYSYGSSYHDGAHLGGGVEHSFGPYYGKVEYRHIFNGDDSIQNNQVLVGAGIKF